MTAPRRPRGPIDPRLWHRSVPVRRHLVGSVALSLVTTACVVVIAVVVGTVLGGAVTDPTRRTVGAWTAESTVLAAAVVVRVLASWARSRYAHRSAVRVVRGLRADMLDAAITTRSRGREDRGEWSTVVTRGLDGLAPYLTDYVPALVLAATVTPIATLVIAFVDPLSAVIVAVTLPTIPVFMVLIGLMTRGRSRRTLDAMTRLSSQLMDLLAGIPTLRALGRQDGPAARVGELGDEHRRRTMAALRVAFLSSMVLELLATLGVALVAVSIGLRLVYGDMELAPGIIALILAPEVYLPLRALGAAFHASEDGAEAAGRAFALLESAESQAPRDERTAAPPTGPVTVVLTNLSVRGRDGWAPRHLDAAFRPGRVTVLTGANGTGKSTVLASVLGLVDPDEGSISLVGSDGVRVDLSTVDLDQWWRRVTWLPQRPAIVVGTVADNLDLGARGDVAEAARATGFSSVLASLPRGAATMLGAGGVGLSVGEAHRLALTRTLAATESVVLLDEPTAHLDPESAGRVLRSLRAAADGGRTVVIVGHTPEVLAAADAVVHVDRAAVSA
ncbi:MULTISPECIES: thiol reductant ABC exporter subunit CydD [Nocardiaceae]|uniref:ATP-binding cassette subfamily C protein CydD n=1 Tax=Rhodococcoides corynebacterioides TaxID=53972 RepID=A0ABS2KPH9_9NOCA|nr:MULTISPECIES: thiol reductant ABC exporter subunit CydD [Rhodococcus]MBM7413555.1 ATP-binding cassette subfamily C protein CydD [Rhodococcus corynebacterioides]MBP1116018.1 ATP-binding cassette subfamily C protein CydD [Rhodococcus sp. PvP016]